MYINPLCRGCFIGNFGYLLGRLSGKKVCNNCEDCTRKIAHLETELRACQEQKSTTNKQILAASTASAYVFDHALAKRVFGKRIKENDLTIVEGIGPKIQQLFHNNNIKTWKSLSNCSVAKCQTILDDAGEAYRIHNPGTWPKQARMAYEGEWEKLLKWQDELDGGR